MKKSQTGAGEMLVDKLRGGKEGPVVFTREEVVRLQVGFEEIVQENLQCQRALYGIAEAHKRHNLQVTHTDNPDGSKGFDLEHVPPEDKPPVTEPVMN